jgi:hypothetical protein
MTTQISLDEIKGPLLLCLDETFVRVHGMYLDKGTTLFETLEGISAVEASSAASAKSATIAAQLDHVRLYLDVLNEFIRTRQETETNWREIWDTIGEVTPEEWESLKQRFRDSHARVMATIKSLDEGSGKYEFGGALSVLVHTAYQLGGLRQALGVIRANSEQK